MIWKLHRFAYLGTTLLMYVTIYGKNVVLGKNRHGLNGFLSWLGWYFKINIHSFHSLRFHTSSYVTSVASVTSSRDGISQKDHLLSFYRIVVQHTHTALSSNLFHGHIVQKYIDQMSPPENKKCSPGKVFGIKPPSNLATGYSFWDWLRNFLHKSY